MDLSPVILTPVEKRWVYIVGAAAIAIGVTGIVLDFYYVALLPFALGLLFLCYYKPAFYVMLICFAVPMSIFINNVGGGLGLSIPTEPMIWLVFVFFVYRQLLIGQVDKRFLGMPLVIFISINIVWMFICVCTSSMLFTSFKYFLARLWFVSVFFFFMVEIFRNQNFMRRFLSYMIYGTAIIVGMTVMKHAAEGFSRAWGYAIMRPFFADHTIYSAYISFFVPVSLMFALRGNWFNFTAFHRILFLGITVVLILGVIFSFTRASWISLVAALAFYGLIKLKVKFRTMMTVLGLVVVVGFIKQDTILYSLEHNKQGSADDLESHAASVSNITTDPSNLERVNRWHCAILMFRERPVFGFGPGTYTFQYAPFQRPEDLTIISTNSGSLGNTHSEYFNALSETGLIGFLSWLGVFLASVATGLQVIYDKDKAPWKRSLATAVLLGLITYYVHAFLNNFSDFDKIAIPLWGFMAVLAALKYYREPGETESAEPVKSL